MPAASLLQIHQLSIAFRGKPVVQELTLSIDAGGTLGLVGESGSGKSVTSLAILGLLDPAAEVRGSIRFDGEELLTLRPEALRRIRGRRAKRFAPTFLIFALTCRTLGRAHGRCEY